MRIPLCNLQYATLISVYPPNLQADPVEKDTFYADLCSLIRDASTDGNVII